MVAINLVRKRKEALKNLQMCVKRCLKLVRIDPLIEKGRVEKVTLDVAEIDSITTRKCEQIKSCIDFYLSKRANLNLQSVADKSGVPYSTLRRIIQINGNPQPEAAIKVFMALGQDKQLHGYMKEFHPEIASLMGGGLSHNQEYEFIGSEDAQYFVNEDYYLILNLSFTNAGTSEEEIAYELGQRGVEKLGELATKGLIVRDAKGRYIGTSKKYKLTFADTKERVRMALNYYRLSEAGSVNNWMSFQTESLNWDGIKALKLLNQKHFNERKDQIYDNPMYIGLMTSYSAAVSSTFVSYCEKGDIQ
ncbi:MAG: hypothetical protein A2X86_12945 [Bdellovibrionales bacterium GWA2_49_15]|nr:MAG: hypothetical protein A2X86_12945 [Bdellovibrionales bacterium GWA2_49_15]HAZ13892.1 hypothetical protein [Bdellovibrionales bacterium]